MQRYLGAGITLLLAVAMLAVPFWSARYIVSLFTLTVITALLAVSVNMLAGEVGLVSMGHAGISAGAAYAIAWAVREQIGVGGQLSLALAVTLLISAVYGLTAMRTNGLVFLMITLALGVVVYGLALKWSTVTGGQSGLTGIRRPESLNDPWVFYYFCFWVLVAVLILLAVVARSPLGLTFRGIRDSESRMASLGYRTTAVKFVAMVISGLIAGLAGVLTVWNSEFLSPSAAAFQVSAMAVIIIIIGGVGVPLGPVIGAALVVAIQYWLSSYVERWPTLLGLLFIVVVILMPRGVAGVISGPRTHQAHLADLFRRLAPVGPSDLSSADLVDARGPNQEG